MDSSTELFCTVWAAGLNANGQLNFDPDNYRVQDDQDPPDLRSFREVCKGCGEPRIVSTLNYTFVDFDAHDEVAGEGWEEAFNADVFQSGCENGNGQVACSHKKRDSQGRLQPGSTVMSFPDKGSFFEGTPDISYDVFPDVRILDSYKTGWVMLLENGQVFTMGDERYQNCLGREVDQDHPAELPGRVYELNNTGPWLSGQVSDDPIVFVAAGGYTCGAVTRSGAVYVWGMSAPGISRENRLFPGLCKIPRYTEVGTDLDIAEVGFGDAHAIAMDVHGSVYVIGDNTDGQLGLGEGAPAHVSNWTKVEMRVPDDKFVSHVSAGPKASFVVLSECSGLPGYLDEHNIGMAA